MVVLLVDCAAFWSDCGIDAAGAWVVSEDGVDGLVAAGVWLLTGGLAVEDWLAVEGCWS